MHVENDSFHQIACILPRGGREPIQGGTKRGEVRMKEKIVIVIQHTLSSLYSLVISSIDAHTLNKSWQVLSNPTIHDIIG